MLPLGVPLQLVGYPRVPLGYSWVPLGYPRGTLVVPWGYLGYPRCTPVVPQGTLVVFCCFLRRAQREKKELPAAGPGPAPAVQGPPTGESMAEAMCSIAFHGARSVPVCVYMYIYIYTPRVPLGVP